MFCLTAVHLCTSGFFYLIGEGFRRQLRSLDRYCDGTFCLSIWDLDDFCNKM